MIITFSLWIHVLYVYFYCTHGSFDPGRGSWKRLADMQESRSNFSVAVHEEHLYAIAGDKEINTNTDSVEVYNHITDTWRYYTLKQHHVRL